MKDRFTRVLKGHIALATAEEAVELTRHLDDGLRIARVNKDGEREVLDDQQRADEAKRARDVIAAECK